MASKLAVLEKGLEHKVKLVLLHAFPLNGILWKHQVEALSSKVHVIAPDLPGFGESPTAFPNNGKGDSIRDYVESIKVLCDERGINKALFGGCSWGGYMIFELWRRYPSLVSGVILCDTRMEADAPAAAENRKKQIETLHTNGGKTDFIAETMVPFLLSEKIYNTRESSPHSKNVVEYVRNTILSTKAETICNALNALMTRENSTDTIPTINVPALLVVGREDKGTPVQASQDMKVKLPSDTSRLEIIEDAGHLSPIEQYEEVNNRIFKFLDEFKLT